MIERHGQPLAEATARSSPGGVGQTFAYRPHLDGIRAVAVYLVLLFHAELPGFAGGFVGVDVFFVLSGYLVTRLLLRDAHSGQGVRFARFWARRFRRLLPAAAITLVVTGIVWSAVVTPAEVSDGVGGFRASFLYVANWYFIAESADYFAADVARNPVLHFWSLSIEEQFYLVWPLLVAALVAVTARFSVRRDMLIRAAVVALGLASLGWAWHLTGSSVARAYYGTDARAYQLLAGAALALSPEVVDAFRRRLAGSSALVGSLALGALLVTASSALDVSVFARGLLATLCTLVLLATLEVAPARGAKSVLASSPVAALGAISYGIYLWHWPVIVVARADHDPGPWAMAAVAALVATGLASLSAWLVERPVRRSVRLDRHPRAVILAGLGLSLGLGLAIVPLLEDDAPTVVTDETGRPIELDWEAARKDADKIAPCTLDDLEHCHLRAGAGDRVMVIGDSQAWSFPRAFGKLAESEDWDLWVAGRGGCNWERGLIRRQPVFETDVAKCLDEGERWYTEVIPAIDPDVVVLVRLEGENRLVKSDAMTADGSWVSWNTPGYWDTIEERVTASLDELTAGGRRVVIIEPIPLTPFLGDDPTNCLSEVETVEEVGDCDYEAQPASPLEEFFREQAEARPGVWTLDLDPYICPDKPVCPAVIDGVIVRRDWGHLTAGFVDRHRDDILAFLKEEGVVEG